MYYLCRQVAVIESFMIGYSPTGVDFQKTFIQVTLWTGGYKGRFYNKYVNM